MKAKFLTIATVVTLALGSVSSVYATDKSIKNEDASTVLTNVSKINKIELHGNVELYVSDGSADQVKVYNKYYSENALVQNQDGVLRISSYTDKKLVVWVTANDLRAITANDNSTVKSFGNLSKIDIDVTLNNNASANLTLDAYKANIKVNDRAKANISGIIDQYSLTQDQSATVNQTNLAAANTSKTVTTKFVKANDQELAIL
ncbi:GIN domain-containing protein [Mucilaginibacter litoreus]|uniref:GIN domain-containing protein n=1 Tax=Mucilaginibacter litoreus TaxID=1048221 RepID=A0ABW3API0_9SPHI